MGLIKKIMLVTSLGMIMLTMGGCVYSNNKGWNEIGRASCRERV